MPDIINRLRGGFDPVNERIHYHELLERFESAIRYIMI